MAETLAVLAAFVAVYSVVAGRVERTWVSGPMVFLAFGLLCGQPALDLLPEGESSELLRTLAELTLALVLFTDASGADLKVLRRVEVLPIRLLGIGLPLTIALGFGAGWLLFGDLSVLEVALIATMLAPTDAALGKPVVTNEAVPDGIRQGLNVESGLNDGICVPILFLFLALATEPAGNVSAWETGLRLFAENVGIGAGIGALVAAFGVWLLRTCRRLGWLSPSWTKVTVIAFAFLCYGAAQALGGSGFIAAFVGGLLAGALGGENHDDLIEAAEGIGDTFSLLTWVLFGAAVVGPHLGGFDAEVLLYALLSLTVVRMLPVYLVTGGLGLGTEGRLFLGWFGPRGLASIVFGVIVMEEELPHGDTISEVVVCTVLLSILLHGVTANPWARAYGARAKAQA